VVAVVALREEITIDLKVKVPLQKVEAIATAAETLGRFYN
jgi:hypothetical protein